MSKVEFNCPICNSIMEEGVIHCDRYALRWVSNKDDKGVPLPFQGVKLNKMLEKSYVDAWICQKCKKVIIDYAE